MHIYMHIRICMHLRMCVRIHVRIHIRITRAHTQKDEDQQRFFDAIKAHKKAASIEEPLTSQNGAESEDIGLPHGEVPVWGTCYGGGGVAAVCVLYACRYGMSYCMSVLVIAELPDLASR
jgi:hypothetical protein